MRRLWRLGTRNWWVSPGRTAAALISVGLGVATVVIITAFYETARRSIRDEVVHRWLGPAHLSIHPPGAHWGTMESSLRDAVAGVDNVRFATARLQRRMRLLVVEDDRILHHPWRSVDAVGITPQTEGPFLRLADLSGRMIEPGERGVVVLDEETAAGLGVELGDTIALARQVEGPAVRLTTVGLFDGQRVIELQQPRGYLALADLQELAGEPGAVSAIDLLLHDHNPQALERTRAAVEDTLAAQVGHGQNRVVSAAARQKILDEAERVTRILLVLAAFISLLTSFFIILTTMSMSLFERRRQLGILRCVGVTRGQLAGLVFIELMPLGLIGTAAGVLLGIGATRIVPYAIRLVPHASPQLGSVVYLSLWGIGLAVASGLFTTLLCSLILLFQVGRETPLAALSSESTPPKLRYAYGAAVIGAILLAVHESLMHFADPTRWLTAAFTTFAGVGTIYLGHILLAPLLVVVLGRPLARLIAPLLGLRPELAEDQFSRTPWRATGVCWVLMVGLSLVVYLGIGSEAVMAVWDFPARLPETLVYTTRYASGESLERVRRLPGVKNVSAVTDVDCVITTPDAPATSSTDALLKRFFEKFTRPVFVAADLDELLNVFKLTFVEGGLANARDKLARGGHVLIPVQTSQNKALHVGDRVTVTVKERSADFEVAGVVQSPALDLAVTALQAESYMQFAAASVLIGSRHDLREKFGLDVVSLILCNLEPADRPPPTDFTPAALPDGTDPRTTADALLHWRAALFAEEDHMPEIAPRIEAWLQGGSDNPPTALEAELQRYGKSFGRVRRWYDEGETEEAWSSLRRSLILQRITEVIERPDALMGSLTVFQQNMGRSIRHATRFLTWLPSLLLPVAAIGIANLMMVSVQIRARHIAVLRAVGAVRSQVIRLILAEAMTLGLLGSVTGLALGLHESYTDNRLTGALVGFYPEFIIPFGTVALGILLTVAACLLAGIGPARWAARSNIIAAMQST